MGPIFQFQTISKRPKISIFWSTFQNLNINFQSGKLFNHCNYHFSFPITNFNLKAITKFFVILYYSLLLSNPSKFQDVHGIMNGIGLRHVKTTPELEMCTKPQQMAPYNVINHLFLSESIIIK